MYTIGGIVGGGKLHMLDGLIEGGLGSMALCLFK